MAEQKQTKVMVKNARASYANVFEAQSINEGDEPKYNISIIIPKTEKETIDKINKAIDKATQVGVSEKFGGKKPANVRNPLRDGDVEREGDKAYENAYFINAKSKRKPQIMDKENGVYINDPEQFYSGCYMHVTVNFYPYAVSGSKGIACGLINILKIADGEPLGGGGAKAEDDFAEFLTDSDFDEFLED
ncbi:DUF2815 family protein [Staphylococcus xylosus]|uniref:DUF2815 family protein n=1 Tax=Staphylococcus xylosus TaxID=1288 RepID=UPI001559BF8B|nr:DUF2815 family protein [Staphylococcus xylosus]NQD97629.1 DUF2815 family protein [Staphylococcus xylosus]